MHSRPPVSLTSLVGRERELSDLDTLLAAQRLVTLTGFGGSGKTRLAAELALRVDWRRADSVAWVELGPVVDPQLVAQHAAAALSLRAPQCGAADALIEALRDREFLLVLDNCEHVVAAAAELARTLLHRSPKLRILATSREPLGVAGEHVWPVPPIAPDDAVQLFVERATAVDATFASASTDVIADICRRLDHIPLAIELAAARVRVLTPEQIAAKLEDRFAILTGGARTADPRHRTLRAAIDWSFALLSDAEQKLMERLSVFSGSFTLEAAEAVCDADLDLLTGLVDKSLVTTKSRRAAIRYQLLDTIRDYAAERLEASSDCKEMRRRHARAYLELARAAAVDPAGLVLLQNIEQLDAEHDNVRAALAWSIEHAPDEIALPLVAHFRWYWYFRILWSEGFRWISRLLERASERTSRDRAGALAGAGAMGAYLGDLATGRAHLEAAESMWRALGDDRELALTLAVLAQSLANGGELDVAQARAAESVALARRSTPFDLAYCLTNAEAFVANRRGDLDAADRALEEAELIWRPARDPLGYPFVLSTRAVLAVRRGDPAAASRLARATMIESRRWNYHWFSARALRVLAFTSTNDLPRAARLLGAADTMLRNLGARLMLHEKAEYDAFLATLRASMRVEELEAALDEGRRWCVDEAYDFALQSNDTAVADTLQVGDLGPLQITLAGKSIASDRASNRARELLVFLLAHPPGPTKEEVGVAFWPDATTEQVKNSFHVTLHRLRKLLGGSETIVADGARYHLAMPHVVASRQFESEAGAALRTNDAARLEAALALYSGDFLQGEDAGEWCLPIRARLRQLHVRALFALGQSHELRGRFNDAAETYERVLARDPFHEPAARQLMICRARLGARSESLSIYRQLEQRLRDDLQTVPEPETSSLYRELRYKTDNAAK